MHRPRARARDCPPTASLRPRLPALITPTSRLISEETEIFFPDSLPFPFTIRSLVARAGNNVEQGTQLLKYSFVARSSEPGTSPETRFGSWEATFEGEFKNWNVKPGEIVSRERAKSRPALCIVEPCKHGVQFNGLCALCGIDMTRCARFLHTPYNVF